MILDDKIRKYTTTRYIAYDNKQIFVELHFLSNRVFINIMSGEYNDKLNLIKKYGSSYNWSNDSRIEIMENDDLEYVKEDLNKVTKKL